MYGAKSAWLRSCAAATELQPDRYTAHSVWSEVANPSSSRPDVPSRYRIGRVGRRGALPRERFSPLAHFGSSGRASSTSAYDAEADITRRTFDNNRSAQKSVAAGYSVTTVADECKILAQESSNCRLAIENFAVISVRDWTHCWQLTALPALLS